MVWWCAPQAQGAWFWTRGVSVGCGGFVIQLVYLCVPACSVFGVWLGDRLGIVVGSYDGLLVG